MLSLKKNKTAKKTNHRLGQNLESLEDRRLMAVDFGQFNWQPEIEFNGDGTDVVISGSFYNDTTSVEIIDNGSDNPMDEVVKITASNQFASTSRVVQRFDPQGNDRIREIVFKGYGGNDSFRNNSDLPSRAYGGTGNDYLRGGSNVDKFWGGNGADQLVGNAGDDMLYGNSGDDVVSGTTGDDFLSGGDGEDRLYGGHGNDELRGDRGNDTLLGGTGNDLLRGGRGDDYLNGFTGNDSLLGDAGRDRLFGLRGNDWLHGGDGNDYLWGGDDDDLLVGGDGSDWLYGENGHDELWAGDAEINLYSGKASMSMIDNLDDDDDDYLYGGSGLDTFRIGDYDMLEIGTDRLKDMVPEERTLVVYADSWSNPWMIFGEYNPQGVTDVDSRWGHLS